MPPRRPKRPPRATRMSKNASTMSSATSTEKVGLTPDATEGGSPVRLEADLQPWQFFVLAALGCATAAVFIARGQGFIVVVLLSMLMGATSLVGIAALRALR